MMKIVSTTLTFLFSLLLTVSQSQTTYTSSQSGNWSSATTWGGAGVPGNNDHAVISSGTVVTHTANEVITNLTINSNGELVSSARLRVLGNYTNNGIHSGSGRVQLRNPGSNISGTGNYTGTQTFRVDNKRTVLPGSSLTFTNNFRCPNNDTLFNHGTLNLSRSMVGNNTTTFFNGSTGILRVQRNLLNNSARLVASASGNQVEYERTGTGNQSIKIPVDGYYDLTISGNNNASVKSLSGTTRIINDFTINGSTFSQVDTFSLYVGGDFSIIGGVYNQANAKLAFNGSSLQTISGLTTLGDVHINNTGSGVSIIADTIHLIGNMKVFSGTLNTNGRLMVVSNATQQGAIGPIASGATINGNVTVQRYIDAGATNWHFMGSPVSGAAISQWQDDFITSGYPGSHFPNFPFTSIYGYDETVGGHQDSGFYEVSSTHVMPAGRGYWVWCGDSLQGTNPFTVDVTGPINQGNVNFNVTYTLSTGLAADGWNLVANPYPSPIDWDSPAWTKFNIDNAVYIYNPDLDQYGSYVAGVGVNGVSNIIASGQGFYVKANLPLPSLIATEGVKYDTVEQFLNQRPPDVVRINLALDQNGKSTAAVIRILDAQVKPNFDPHYEAYFIPAPVADAAGLFIADVENNLIIAADSALDFISHRIAVTNLKQAALLTIRAESFGKGDYCHTVEVENSNERNSFDEETSFHLSGNDTIFLILKSRRLDGGGSCDEQINQLENTESVHQKVWFDGERIRLQNTCSDCPYRIFDSTGSLVHSGELMGNTSIPFSGNPAGVYYLLIGDDSFRIIQP
ncbi:MAG: hypothetical protein Kow0075_09440 [Salibacteraceae bacterium]